MDILTPKTVPFIFIIVAAVFAFNYVRHRGQDDTANQIAQRSRLRMTFIFGAVGVGQLLWRLFSQG